MTAVAVELCVCGHAPRIHERDEDAELGRGGCAQRACDCSEFRPGSVDAEQAPVVDRVVFAASEPVEEPDTKPAASFPCPVCGKGFPSPQGRGGHRAKAHPGSKNTGASAAAAGTPSPVPDQPRVETEAPAVAIPPAADLADDQAEAISDAEQAALDAEALDEEGTPAEVAGAALARVITPKFSNPPAARA